MHGAANRLPLGLLRVAVDTHHLDQQRRRGPALLVADNCSVLRPTLKGAADELVQMKRNCTSVGAHGSG
ncbi:MAG: hypothetical protein ACK5WG_01060, partial [Betaproteobacteria bacterium]